MPNLKDLKNRIESVKSTRKITKAMQMVAAAKLRRAQESAEASRPYAARFNAVMAGLAASVGGSDSAPKLLRGTGSDDVHLLVVMTAERGLCGGFNSNIAKLARAKAYELQAKGKTVKILTVGKKGRDAIKREYGDLFVGHVDLSEVKRLGYTNAQDIAKDVLSRFDGGEFDVATIFYSKFVNVVNSRSSLPRSRISRVTTAARCSITSPAKKPFWLICCLRGLQLRSSRACSKTGPRNRVHGCLQWTTQHATRVR